MRKKYVVLVLLGILIFVTKGYGQNSYSSLYNKDGSLLCDSNYKVENLLSMPIFLNDERLLFNYLITRVHYPFKAISNGISGKVILKIKIENSNNNKHVFLVTNVSYVSENVSIITEDITNQVKDILSECYFIQRNKKGRVNCYELFIPFEFKYLTDEVDTNVIKSYFSDMGCFTFTYAFRGINSHGNIPKKLIEEK